jgi:hypothetical protein
MWGMTLLKRRMKNARGALVGVVALATVVAPLALGVHAAGATDGVQVTTQFNPDQDGAQVNAGNSAEWSTSLENNSETDFSNVSVTFDLFTSSETPDPKAGGSVNLSVGTVTTASAENPTPVTTPVNKVCKKSMSSEGAAKPFAARVNEVVCNVGDFPAFSVVDFDMVVTTDVKADPGTTIEGDVNVFGNPELFDSEQAFLQVNPADPSSSTGFVPPGGTIKQGPKVPDAQTPAIGAFTLPKKEFILPPPPPPGFVGPLFTNAKAVPGPGVQMTIELLPADSNLTACGGQPCDGPIVNFSDFSGYNDPKHPALFTVSFFGDVFGTDTHLYIIVNGVGTPAPICTKVGGVVSNFPCIKGKDKLNKKTGQWTDVVEMLSQDSGMSRRR